MSKHQKTLSPGKMLIILTHKEISSLGNVFLISTHQKSVNFGWSVINIDIPEYYPIVKVYPISTLESVPNIDISNDYQIYSWCQHTIKLWTQDNIPNNDIPIDCQVWRRCCQKYKYHDLHTSVLYNLYLEEITKRCEVTERINIPYYIYSIYIYIFHIPYNIYIIHIPYSVFIYIYLQWPPRKTASRYWGHSVPFFCMISSNYMSFYITCTVYIYMYLYLIKFGLVDLYMYIPVHIAGEWHEIRGRELVCSGWSKTHIAYFMVGKKDTCMLLSLVTFLMYLSKFTIPLIQF